MDIVYGSDEKSSRQKAEDKFNKELFAFKPLSEKETEIVLNIAFMHKKDPKNMVPGHIFWCLWKHGWEYRLRLTGFEVKVVDGKQLVEYTPIKRKKKKKKLF